MPKIELTEKQILGMLSFICLSSVSLEEDIKKYEEEYSCINSSDSQEALYEMIKRRKKALSCAKEVREKLYKAK